MTSKARNIADLGSNDVIETTATGVDVTGTVTTDGLVVDGSITANLGSAHKVQLSGNYPYVDMVETDTADVNTRLQNSSGNFLLRTVNDADTSAYTRLKVDHATGDVSFYEDTGTTAKMVWDASAESLSVPDLQLSLSDTNSTGTIGRTDRVYIEMKREDFDGSINFYTTTNGSSGITNRMTISDTGNVGIGTDSPTQSITTDGNALVGYGASSGSYSYYFRGDTSSGNNAAITKNHGGSLNILASMNNSVYQPLVFKSSPDTERARIDSSGNLLVGTTTGVPNCKLTVTEGASIDGIITYQRSTGSLSTTGISVAGLNPSYNGQSAVFEFTGNGGGSGGAFKILFNCYNGGGTWVVQKTEIQASSKVDITYANGIFTFKSKSGTQAYSPRVKVEAYGANINTAYM